MRRIGEAAKGRFLAALRAGLGIEEAARAAGHSASGFCAMRRREAAFAADWAEAMAESSGPMLIRANNGRRLQLRRMRHVKFDDERKAVFLSHFAGTCDVEAAALAAGVDESTVYKRRQRDPDFAAAWEDALQLGYARLEAEALRQRLEAQKKLRDGLIPAGEIATEFERVMKLLDRWDRRNGKIGTRSVAPGRQQSWTFDAAMEALEKKLTALGYSVDEEEGPHPGPLPQAGEGEGA